MNYYRYHQLGYVLFFLIQVIAVLSKSWHQYELTLVSVIVTDETNQVKFWICWLHY